MSRVPSDCSGEREPAVPGFACGWLEKESPGRPPPSLCDAGRVGWKGEAGGWGGGGRGKISREISNCLGERGAGSPRVCVVGRRKIVLGARGAGFAPGFFCRRSRLSSSDPRKHFGLIDKRNSAQKRENSDYG